MNLRAWTALALLGLRANRAIRGVGGFLDELKAVVLLRGWYFESAEGSQSRYGFAEGKKEPKAFANRVHSVQQEHKDLVAGVHKPA